MERIYSGIDRSQENLSKNLLSLAIGCWLFIASQ